MTLLQQEYHSVLFSCMLDAHDNWLWYKNNKISVTTHVKNKDLILKKYLKQLLNIHKEFK